MFCHKNHAAGEANSSIMVGMFVCCVFCQPNAFQARVSIPARTDLAVKWLMRLTTYPLWTIMTIHFSKRVIGD
jgi:hypothetical protein